jgi:hypothetical protein
VGVLLAVTRIHTFLVHPKKGSAGTPQIGGTKVPLSGKLFRLLDNIFSTSEDELNIDIAFNRSADGRQRNPCRDLVIDYVRSPTLANGRRIAERLSKVTDQRSGLGLVFLIVGNEGANHKIVISRFPTDTAILAEEKQASLTVEFLERVFMKSANSYKAVEYQDATFGTGSFWVGRAIDKQINSPYSELSNYWIVDFLDSTEQVTAAAGTRRLAMALREAAKKAADVQVKSEIVAAATLAGGFQGKRITVSEFVRQLGLSREAAETIISELRNVEEANEYFRFDTDEFKSHVGYRSVELSNGGMLTAEADVFEDVFHRQEIGRRRVRYSTEGEVVNEKLRKSK